MKTVITVAVAALMLATPAIAEVYLVAKTQDHVYYVDDALITPLAPGLIRMQQTIVRRSKSKTTGADSEKRIDEYDCGKDTYSILSGTEYDASGGVVRNYDYRGKLVTIDVFPRSVAAHMYAFVCDPAKRSDKFVLPPDTEPVRFTREQEAIAASQAAAPK